MTAAEPAWAALARQMRDEMPEAGAQIQASHAARQHLAQQKGYKRLCSVEMAAVERALATRIERWLRGQEPSLWQDAVETVRIAARAWLFRGYPRPFV